MSSSIPTFYRVCFTVIDPILSLTGILGNLFAPSAILNSYSPSALYPAAPETTCLLDSQTGCLAALNLLQVFLLRARPADLLVWQTLQAALFLTDVGMLSGVGRALGMEGRTDWRLWRVEEWTNIGIIVGVMVLRSAFLMGVGMGGGNEVPKSQQKKT